VTPEEHLAGVEPPRREDVRRLHELITATAPELEVQASAASLGYGPFRYRYESGREGDSHLVTVMNRKGYIAMYVNSAQDGTYVAERFAPQLPKVSIGKSCIRIKRVDDLDLDVLREVVRTAVATGGTGAVQPPPS
jgi:hypothetical protein